MTWIRAHLTLRRWNRNPFQLWMLLAMSQVSANQLLFAPDTGVISEESRQAQISLATCNLVGGLICLMALHLRDKRTALLIEMCSYVALIGSMGIYVALVWSVTLPPNTSFGLGLSQAFVLASAHRSILIALGEVRQRLGRRHRRRIRERRLRSALRAAGIDPREVDVDAVISKERPSDDP